MIKFRIIVLVILIFLVKVYISAQEKLINISNSTIVTPKSLSQIEINAVNMFKDEVLKRTMIDFKETNNSVSTKLPKIIFATINSIKSLKQKINIIDKNFIQPEGYRIWIDNINGTHNIIVVGNDSRGLLFGIGKLLRTLRMNRYKIEIPENLKIVTAPEYNIRGHQMGYRAKPNSYDGWNLQMWEQYIRDLAVFGTNTIELIPPDSDDLPDSPHFPLPKLETMIGVSKIAQSYGLDVSIWYPALKNDYTDKKNIELEVKEWFEVLKQLPKVNSIFVPCGDPGNTPPEILLPMIAKQVESIKKIHPNVKWWIAPQGFDAKGLEVFQKLIQQDLKWLYGIGYGPWMRMSIDEFREYVPRKYPIRHYPDITHSSYCQYPVPNWDIALAVISGREPINPRPQDMATIFRHTQPYTIGFVSYSEGCHDDLNKIIWSSLGWNSKERIEDIVDEYSRYFIGEKIATDFSKGLFDLENNWRDKLLENTNVDSTLNHFIKMEKSASPKLLLNWRFQMALFRAHYDSFIKDKYEYETNLENNANTVLANAKNIGADKALEEASTILKKHSSNQLLIDKKNKLLFIAEILFQSIRLQLDTERYKASRPDAAVLDRINMPLNSRNWLLSRFAEIKKLNTEQEKLSEIQKIIDWKNPGVGGFYDDLGIPDKQPHLVSGLGFEKDPYVLKTPNIMVGKNPKRDGVIAPFSWVSTIASLYDHPIIMRYDNLDLSSHYKLKIVYTDGPITLIANDTTVIHPLLEDRHKVLEFDIPQKLTSKGSLKLSWTKTLGEGKGGWGNQIAEVWLIKK